MFLAQLASVASGHVGDVVAGIDAEMEEPAISIEASYGLLVGQPDGFAWICHEAVTTPEATRSPDYLRLELEEGLAWLSVLSDPAQARDGATLWRSDDGCSWQVPQGTEGLVIYQAAARAEPTSGLEVLLAAGPDGLLRSIDGGRTFTPHLAAPDRHFRSVMGDGQGWWATATDPAGDRLFVWTDGGQGQWVEHEIGRPASTQPPIDFRLLAVDGTNAWVVVDPLGYDVLLALSASGASSRALETGSPGNFTDLAVSPQDGRLWFVRDGVFLYSLTEGPEGSEVTSYPSYPPAIGFDLHEGALWAVPQSQLSGALLSRSTDGGETFETIAHPDDITAPLSCPPDSDVALVCEPLWEQLLPRIRGFDQPIVDTGTAPEVPEIPPHPEDPAQPEPDARGCGCTSTLPVSGEGAGGAAVLGLMLALGWTGYGRRRRSAGPAGATARTS